MRKELICINCPLGCRITAEYDESGVTGVSGNNCKRGEEYAVQEVIKPMRVLTGIMRIKGEERPLSVRTNAPVPKSMLLSCAAELKRHQPEAPVHMGDVVIRDLLGTGADVVATQNFDKIW